MHKIGFKICTLNKKLTKIVMYNKTTTNCSILWYNLNNLTTQHINLLRYHNNTNPPLKIYDETNSIN